MLVKCPNENVTCTIHLIPIILTCEQLAMVLVGRPIEGAQPTSLTQSLWASSFWSSFHWPSSSLEAGSDNQWRLNHKPSVNSLCLYFTKHLLRWQEHTNDVWLMMGSLKQKGPKSIQQNQRYHLFYSMHSSSFSKPSAYITHNAT